jgi:protein-S-isoprenylcysteine O-methyltransferase Ste14
MYVAEAMLWFGCAIFFGSISILIGLVILCVAVNVLVRHEEPALEAEFGETYLRYKATVPRWLGKRLPNATLNPAAGAQAEGDGR